MGDDAIAAFGCDVQVGEIEIGDVESLEEESGDWMVLQLRSAVHLQLEFPPVGEYPCPRATLISRPGVLNGGIQNAVPGCVKHKPSSPSLVILPLLIAAAMSCREAGRPLIVPFVSGDLVVTNSASLSLGSLAM